MRAVQVEACRVIFDTDAHLLLAAGTASGKTEAAFLPIITLLHEEPPATVGVLYIGPTKALINDQFLRLDDLLKEADIPVWHWHGDVSQSHKTKLLKKPGGILQITPESLESLLINKSGELVRLFGDLRFVVIDEVHVFMGSDRGRQVLCQLMRLARFGRTEPRRIGLSATLGDYSLAEAWLRAGTKSETITPKIDGGQQKIRLAVEHFFIEPQKSLKEVNSQEKSKGSPAQTELSGSADEKSVKPLGSPYYRYIFEVSKARKCLIFANNRSETESVVASLRQIAEAERLPDIYHVHHGSIAAPLREAAETAMRESMSPAVTAATLTLELGIDIGQLERVVQLGAPHSVSSFLQRLGRSGRRGNPSEMWFVCSEEAPTGKELLPLQIPWHLLQCIAIIQLYIEERFIEPIQPVKYPFSLLYHQTMSTLASTGELSPAALAQRVLTLSPFRHISQDDFRELLLHLLEIDHIQKTDERGLIIGLAGETVVRNFRFYAVFPDNEEYSVREESREIGSIIMPPPPGERFILAGKSWEVLEIDLKRKTVFVKPVKGKANIHWHGSGGTICTRILQRMRQVLFEDIEYSYLQKQARERIASARKLARSAGLDRSSILPLGQNACSIFPWMGSIAYRTLERWSRHTAKEELGIMSTGGISPYFLTVQLRKPAIEELRRRIASVCEEEIDGEDLVGETEAPQLQKYDEYVPPRLLRKAFAADCLDTDEMKREVGKWR